MTADPIRYGAWKSKQSPGSIVQPQISGCEWLNNSRRSGLTRAAFSKQYGIPLATLSRWLAKTKRALSLPVPVVFREVRLQPPATEPINPWAIEVVGPSGLTVRCREALAVRDLARLLRG